MSHPPCGGCGLKLVRAEILRTRIASPSLRRVWVEITFWLISCKISSVTLLAEGVG